MKKVLLAFSLVLMSNLSFAALMTADAHKIGTVLVDGTTQTITLWNDTGLAWGGTGTCSGTYEIYWTPLTLDADGNAFSDQLLETALWAKQNDKKVQINGDCTGGKLFAFKMYVVD